MATSGFLSFRMEFKTDLVRAPKRLEPAFLRHKGAGQHHQDTTQKFLEMEVRPGRGARHSRSDGRCSTGAIRPW